MNTNLKSFRWWPLLLCCVLLNTTRAQTVEPPASGKDAAVQAPAGEHHSDVAGGDQPADEPAASDHGDTDVSGDGDDDSSMSSDTEESGNHDHHKHHKHGSDDVIAIGRPAELREGEHADSVIAVFGSATSAGDVSDSVISVLGNTRVTGPVGDAAVAVMGNVYINSEIKGDVVAILGNVSLGPEARVRGNVVVVGGELTRDPKSVIEGQAQHVFGENWAEFDWLRPWIERCLLYGRPLAFAPGLGWAWGFALGLLALYLFIAFVFREAVERCVHTLETQPGHSILAALLTLLLTPVLFVLLFITVLGIAAVPFLAIALLCAAIFGKVVVLAFIGRRCTPMLAANPLLHTVAGVLVGGAIVLVLYTIPVIGFIVYKLLGILGLGVVVYALLIAVRTGRQARTAGGAGPGPGGVGPSGAGPGPGGVGPSGVGPGGPGGVGPSGVGPGGPGSVGPGGVGPGGFVPGGGSGTGSGAGTAAGASGTAAADGAAVADGAVGAGGAMGAGGAVDAGGAAGATAAFGAVPGSHTSHTEDPYISDFDTAPSGDAHTSGFGAAAGGAADQHTSSGSSATANFGGNTMGASSETSGTAAGGGPTFGDFSAPPNSAPPPNSPPPGAAAGASAASFPHAGFGIRMAALLLDLILVGIILHQVSEGSNIFLIALATYGAVMWRLRGSTIGGIICGLQVVRLDSRPVDWPTAIVRALSCFLSLAVVGLGFLWIAIDSDRQAWHDKIAGTVVVRAPKGRSLL